MTRRGRFRPSYRPGGKDAVQLSAIDKRSFGKFFGGNPVEPVDEVDMGEPHEHR